MGRGVSTGPQPPPSPALIRSSVYRNPSLYPSSSHSLVLSFQLHYSLSLLSLSLALLLSQTALIISSRLYPSLSLSPSTSHPLSSPLLSLSLSLTHPCHSFIF